MTLAETSISWAIWSLKRPPPIAGQDLQWREGGHQPTHKPFNPKFDLPFRCAEIKMEQRWKEWIANDLSNLRPTPWERVNLNTTNDTWLFWKKEA